MLQQQSMGARFRIGGCSLLLVSMLSWWALAGVSAAAPRLSPIKSPTISGNSQVGQTLSEGHGTWSSTPLFFMYKWEDCDTAGQRCVPISGATKQTYVVAPSDLGHTLRVQETAFSRSGSAQATSAPTPVTRIGSTTSVTSLERSAVTDQIVTLIATVTSSSAASPPSGTVTFENGGAPIPGCQNEPILPTGQGVTVTCQTAFAASVEQLSAAFTPSPGSTVGGSASAPATLPVGPAPTSTSLAVSRRTVPLRGRVTYTATVRPAELGPMTPSQGVGFFDNGRPVRACASRPVVWTGAVAVARCTVRYRRSGQHLMTARYAGDANFTSSSSAAKLLDAVAGRIDPTLRWSFYFTPRYTKVLALVVEHAPPHARVGVTCTGRGCPSHVLSAPGSTRTSGTGDLARRFRGRRLRPGAVIVVTVRRRGWIGKRYTFHIRAAHPPRLRISCKAPGLRPGVGC